MKLVEKGKITYLIGEKNSGKSTYLLKLISKSPDKYVGFVTLPVKYSHQKKGYFLYGINIPFRELLAASDPVMLNPPLFYWRNRFFSRSIFERVTGFIMENFAPGKIYVIDEYGPLEREGKGWNKLITFLVKKRCKMMVVITMRSGEKKLEIPV